jgi:hypothetical protein
MPVLAVWTPEDGLLGALAPLGLGGAAAKGPTLVIDLDEQGPRYPSETSLAELVAAGPKRGHLLGTRSGLAVIRNGGVNPDRSRPVVEALMRGWEWVVLRLPPRPPPTRGSVPVVPVRMILPGRLFEDVEGPSVFQSTAVLARLPGPGVRLPVPSRTTVAGLVTGRLPHGADRWIRAWRRVWEVSWDR